MFNLNTRNITYKIYKLFYFNDKQIYNNLTPKFSGFFFITDSLRDKILKFIKNKLIFIINLSAIVIWARITYKVSTNFTHLSIYDGEFYVYLLIYSIFCGLLAVLAQVIKNCAFDSNKTNYFTTFFISFLTSFTLLPVMFYMDNTFGFCIIAYLYICMTILWDSLKQLWLDALEYIRQLIINIVRSSSKSIIKIILSNSSEYDTMGPSGEKDSTEILPFLLMDNPGNNNTSDNIQGSSSIPGSSNIQESTTNQGDDLDDEDTRTGDYVSGEYRSTKLGWLFTRSNWLSEDDKTDVINSVEVPITWRNARRDWILDESYITDKLNVIKTYDPAVSKLWNMIDKEIRLYDKLIELNIDTTRSYAGKIRLLQMQDRLFYIKTFRDYVWKVQSNFEEAPRERTRLRLDSNETTFIRKLCLEYLKNERENAVNTSAHFKKATWIQWNHSSFVPIHYGIERCRKEGSNILAELYRLDLEGKRMYNSIGNNG